LDGGELECYLLKAFPACHVNVGLQVMLCPDGFVIQLKDNGTFNGTTPAWNFIPRCTFNHIHQLNAVIMQWVWGGYQA